MIRNPGRSRSEAAVSLALLRWALLLLAAAAQPARAQGQVAGDSLSLAEIYGRIDSTLPRVMAATATARAAAARIGPARRPPDPELQVGLMNRQLPGFGLDPVLGMNQIQLTQMIPVAGQLGLAAKVERAKTAAAGARAREVRLEERGRAAMAFFELYETDHSIAVTEETRRLLQDLAAIVSSMYAVGQGRQPDVLRAQVELARMTEDLVRMAAMRTGAAARLNAVLNVPSDVRVAPPTLPVFPDSIPSRDSLQALALARRPMLAAGAEDVHSAEAAERLAGREIWPDLEIGVQYGWRPMETGTDHMASLMLGLRVPIWAGSRQKAMQRETAAMREMATADLASMEADTRARVAELYADVQRTRTLLQLYRTSVLPQAGATVASSLAAYRVGGVDFMTLLDARMSLGRYRQDTIRLEADLGRAFAELEMLTGTDLMHLGVGL